MKSFGPISHQPLIALHLLVIVKNPVHRSIALIFAPNDKRTRPKLPISENTSINLKSYRKIIKYVWLLVIAISLTSYLLYPEYFTADALRNWIDGNHQSLIILYVVLVLVRAVMFIPSTVVLVMGISLFPEQLTFLFIVNMLGIIAGSILLYYASNLFDVNALFGIGKQEQLNKIKEKINRFGFSIVLGWSFFPFVPTDLICYVAGLTKMHLTKFLAAVIIGESVLVLIYLLSGKELMSFLLG